MALTIGLGALGLGAVLQRFSSDVSSRIEQARQAGLTLEIEAGRQVRLALDHFSNSYSDSMNETVDRLDGTVQDSYSKLRGLVQTFQSGNNDQIILLTSRVQQFVNTLPAGNLRPQVTFVTPQYIPPSRDPSPFTLHIQGNFPNIGRPDMVPTLRLSNRLSRQTIIQDYRPHQTTVQEMTFNLPMSLLGSGEERRVTLTSGELRIPHEEGGILGFGARRVDHIFHLLLGMLPRTPGTIRLRIISPGQAQPRTQLHQSQEFMQEAPTTWGERTYEIAPMQGWSVVRGTARIKVLAKNEDWGPVYDEFDRDDSNRVLWKVSTKCYGHYQQFEDRAKVAEQLRADNPNSGIAIMFGPSPHPIKPFLRFKIEFQEYQDYVPEVTREEEIHLPWKDSKVIELPPHAQWRVSLQAFNGTNHEIAQTTLDNRFITVQSTPNSLTIGTVNPSTLNLL
ncbi:MAG: hypothetical protein JSR58_00180 [Verrucomicrobia bacterium]|nr:hypothetical protein [Verrucomicrobiota bacterium]